MPLKTKSGFVPPELLELLEKPPPVTQDVIDHMLATVETVPNPIDERRMEILRHLDETIDAMHELATKRMSEPDHRIAAAVALSDLARTWEGMVRGAEKEDRLRRDRAFDITQKTIGVNMDNIRRVGVSAGGTSIEGDVRGNARRAASSRKGQTP